MKDLKAKLRERLTHNIKYLVQSDVTRAASAQLSYGKSVSADWLRGESDAIRAENEFIEQLLKP